MDNSQACFDYKVTGTPYINDKQNYRLWNLISKKNGVLIKQNDDNSVSCNGDFTPIEDNTIIMAEEIIRNHHAPSFAFKFKNNGHYMKAEDSSPNGYTVSTVNLPGVMANDDQLRFDVDTYNSFVLFKNHAYNMYLGCTKDGIVGLYDFESILYPNPQCLFIPIQVK